MYDLLDLLLKRHTNSHFPGSLWIPGVFSFTDVPFDGGDVLLLLRANDFRFFDARLLFWQK
jgi:hypothetical protein